MESIVLVPIITGNKKLYATIVLFKLARKEIKTKKGSKSTTYTSMITQLNQNLYQAVANQIAIAVDKNKILESLRIERDRKEIANEIIQQISSDEDLANSLKTTLNKIVKILKADVGYIALLSKHTKVVEPTCLFRIKENNFPYLEVGDESITGWVYNNKKAYLWPSGKKEIDSLNVPFKYLEKDVETEIIAPLLYGSEVIGFIEVASKREKAFYEEDKIFMESLADQVAVIIQNRKFSIATEMLAEIHFDEKDVQKNCDILAENADEILENSTTCVFLKKKKKGKNVLVMESCHGVQIRNNDEYDMIEGEGGISWQTVENKSEIIIPEDLRNPEHGFKHIDFIIENSLESMISVPLIIVSEVIGVLNSYSRRSYKFLDKEVYLLKSLAAKGAIAIKNAELTKQIEEVSEKILDSAQLANPGHVAMSFTHDAKHTMHNINALISSLIYFLPDKIRETANVRNVIDSITNDTDYLRKLFNSLVRYAKKTDIHYKPTKLREIIEYILYIYKIRLTRNNIRCQVRYGDKELEEVYIECDRSQIEQVFLNLFNNSVYAIREKMTKGGLISIFIRALDDNYIEIQFRDNGIGIFPKDIEYVFEPFFTKKGDKGSGFGLSICKRIIEDNHFGEISVKSEYNKYTTIFIKLEQINLEHNI
jgi:signal transduction histidine kinase